MLILVYAVEYGILHLVVVTQSLQVEFVSDIKGGSVPKEYIPGGQKGIESVLGNGVVAGFPVLGIKVVDTALGCAPS